MKLADLFKKKTIFEKIKSYAEAGNSGKLAKLCQANQPAEVRLAAIDALKEVKFDELAVNTLMSLLNEDNREISLAVCESLKKIGTRREVEVLRHKAESVINEDEELGKALHDAAVEAKERSPRF